MRIHGAPEHNTEHKIIQILLLICLSLGFVSIVLVYLPHRLKSAGASNANNQPPRAKLESVLPRSPTENEAPGQRVAETNVPVFLFKPESDPTAFKQDTAKLTDADALETEVQREMDDALYKTHPRQIKHRMSSLVDGSASRQTERGGRWWETPRGLETEVEFWKNIYTKYSTSQVVLHDPDYLQIIYDVVDLSDIESNPSLGEREKQNACSDRINAARDRIESTLKSLNSDGEAALRSRMGKKISRLFATVDGHDKFKEALKRGVRAQTGQRDMFIQALKTSGQYLGEIELIFKSYDLPRELTRLVFVESMFQLGARSKAGAAGLWQFMPGTGKKYLRVNRIIDERMDPLLATHAAAKLLRHNYEVLGTWPLAINAYNAGRGRLQQAVAATGTTDIGTIIRNFDHPSYGFASRNFFLEFVAAREIVDNADRFFGKIDYDSPLSYDVIELPFHISLPEVAKMADISIDDLIRLNPAFDDRVFSGKMPVPMGSTLRVPENSGTQFLALAERARNTTRMPLEHIVAKGESLGEIAAMYGVPESRIMEANPGLKRKPKSGQHLYIPFD